MFRLLAFHNGHRLDREFLLVGGDTYVLGRGDDANLHVTWDELISRRHVELHAEATGVTIRKLAEKSNPVFVDGAMISVATLASGDAFVIGSSRFEVQQVTQSDSPDRQPIQQLAIDRQQLQRVRRDLLRGRRLLRNRRSLSVGEPSLPRRSLRLSFTHRSSGY